MPIIHCVQPTISFRDVTDFRASRGARRFHVSFRVGLLGPRLPPVHGHFFGRCRDSQDSELGPGFAHGQ